MGYKEKLGYCPHCKDVPDGEPLQRHIRKHRKRLHANKNLGAVFLVLALAFSMLLAATFM